jgi:hypothetical protein
MKVARVLLLCLLPGVTAPVLAAEPAVDRVVVQGVPAAAIAAIEDWFRRRTRDQQVFRLFGYAGTGKTTITRHAIGELGLEPMDRTGGSGGVLYAAFTGKAARCSGPSRKSFCGSMISN